MDFTPYQDIYANLVAAGLQSAALRFGTLVHRAPKDSPGTRAIQREWTQLGNRQLAELAAVPALDHELGGERLRAFLVSAEARDIVVGAAIASLSGSDELDRSVRARFLATFSWYVEVPEAELAADAQRLYASIVRVVDAAVDQLAAAVGDDEAALAAVVADVGAAAARATSVMSRGAPPDFAAVAGFESRYRKSVVAKFGRIEPPNYEGATIPHDALYVARRFALAGEGTEVRVVLEDQLHDAIHRTIVLGNPGAGKSSFAKAVCFRYASANAQEPLEGATPFFLELREYAVHKEREGLSLTASIQRVVSSSFQITAPDGAVEYLLSSGRAIVVFDGLDELTAAHSRKQVRDDVDAFAALYPYTRILVTSRTRNYWEAPLDSRRFVSCTIEDFDEAQIETYSQKWFGLDRSLSAAERSAKTSSFLSESRGAGDLRSNPLLLALMCAIYKRQNFIPANRSAVYQQCADMLFDRWDQSRGIVFDRPLDSRLQEILQHVARWIYEDQDLQAGVTARALRELISDYLLKSVEIVDDRAEADALAERFVTYCHGRGWVLVATGRTADDEELYEFTHRTFLEFFAAAWHAGSGSTSNELADVLLPHVEVGEWEMVALLAVQLRKGMVRQSTDDIIELTLNRAESRELHERANLLAFAARCYEFYVPRIAITRRLARLLVDAYLEQVADDWASDSPLPTALRNVIGGDEEAQRPALEEIAECLVKHITAGTHVVQAADVAFHLRPFVPGDKTTWYQKVTSTVWERTGPRLLQMADGSEVLAKILLSGFVMPIGDVIDRFGVAWLFRQQEHPGLFRMAYSPMADAFLSPFIGCHTYMFMPRHYEEALRSVGEGLAAAPLPWLEDEPEKGGLAVAEGPPVMDFDALAPEAQAWLLVLLAVRLEMHTGPDRARFREAMATRDDSFARAATRMVNGDGSPQFDLDDQTASLVQTVLDDSRVAVTIVKPAPTTPG